MRTLVLAIAILLAVIPIVYSAQWVQSPNVIQYVNSVKPGWRAGVNLRFENVTRIQAGLLLGLKPSNNTATTSPPGSVTVVNLPDEFDSDAQWSKCVQPIRDQEGCGACWAFAGGSVLGIRTCIASGQTNNVILSTQYPTSCDSVNGGCDGGTLPDTWDFFQNSGDVADSDYVWTDSLGITSTCKEPAATKTKYYASSYTQFGSTSDMMTDIFNNGPIQVGFDVYNDFFSYTSGVYSYTMGAFAGG
jgi:cathepsin B